METADKTSPVVAPPPLQKASGELLLQRKCACGSSAGLSGACDQCQDKRLTVQRYSRERATLGGLLTSLDRSLFSTPSLKGQGGHGNESGNNFGLMKSNPSRTVQTKLVVGAPGDPLEQEADRVAELVVGRSALEQKQQPTSLSHSHPVIQRAIRDDATNSEDNAAGNAPAGLIVEDDAPQIEPGQMRKNDFLDQLRNEVCAAADAELAAVGRSTEGCPYIERWIGHYRTRSGQQTERALRRYTPEAAGATNARDYIPLVAARVRSAVAVWATTGKITGVPEGVSAESPESEPVETAAGESAAGKKVLAKGRDGASAASAAPDIQAQLGHGRALDGGVKSRMESAFGYDFSQVRVHTDSKADELSGGLSARAFTIGSDVAFAGGEYKPGTLIGDALLAHELAHVVQQDGATAATAPKDETGDTRLEEEADLSAVSAVVSLWGGAKGPGKNLRNNSMTRLRSGLRLSRCATKREKLTACVQPVRIADDDGQNPTTLPSFDLTKQVWQRCCVSLTVNEPQTVRGSTFKEMDESPSDTPTAEEQKIYLEYAKSGAPGCITVFVPVTFRKVIYTITDQTLAELTTQKVAAEILSKLQETKNTPYGADDFTEMLRSTIPDETVRALVLKHASRTEEKGKQVSGGGATYKEAQKDAMVFVLEGSIPRIVAHEVGHALGYFGHEQGGSENITNPNSPSNAVNAEICGTIRDRSQNINHTGVKDCKWET